MTRRVISFMVALMLAVALFAASAQAASYGYVNTSGYVRMRSGPGDYPSVASVKGGTKVEVLGSSGSWFHVKLVGSSYEGYIYKQYISKSNSGESGNASLGFTGTTCTVKVSSTALRKGTSKSAGTVATLGKGAELVIAGASGKYYKALNIHTGKKGYVLKTAVKMGASAHLKGKAYLRSAASSSAGTLRAVPKGEKVIIYKVYENWSRVTYNGKTGYIYNSYLKP